MCLAYFDLKVFLKFWVKVLSLKIIIKLILLVKIYKSKMAQRFRSFLMFLLVVTIRNFFEISTLFFLMVYSQIIATCQLSTGCIDLRFDPTIFEESAIFRACSSLFI